MSSPFPKMAFATGWVQAVQSSPAFLTVCDENFRIVFQNHFQPGVDDPCGTSIFGWFPSEHHEKVRQCLSEARASGRPQTYELEGTGPDGLVSKYSSWVTTLSLPTGELGFGIISTDTTQMERVEDALSETASTLKSVVENAPDDIAAVDRQHLLVFLNRSPEKEDFAGRPFESLLPEQAREDAYRAIEKVFASGEPTSFDVFREEAGGFRYFTTRLGAVRNGEEIDKVVLITTETTLQVLAQTAREDAQLQQRELLEQLHQSQKMEAMGQLTGGVAHDFNNLLTIMLGNLDALIRRKGLSEDQRQLVENAKTAGSRATNLTQRLLAFSRRQTLSPQVHSLSTIIQELRPLLERALPNHVELKFRLSNLPLYAEVDRTQLENSLLNLVINSRDAIEEHGWISIELNSKPSDASTLHDEWIELAVEDSGHGIEADSLDRVIEPFYTTKDVGEGSGLGLSMVYGFVQQSQGKFSLESEPGKGTRVRLLFQAVSSVDFPPETLPRERLMPRGSGELVLVVEDSSLMRRLAVQQVVELGYKAKAVSSGTQALEVVHAGLCPDIVMTDYLLPGGVTGVELVRQLREKFDGLPALIVSGYADLHQRPEVLQRVGAHLLGKPFELVDLAQALSSSLAARRETDDSP
ncbi:MAG: ATP-binding protein [Polyangiaceae bacterium]|nr:ATP-binding protein [Polyangiaceae bacterium]